MYSVSFQDCTSFELALSDFSYQLEKLGLFERNLGSISVDTLTHFMGEHYSSLHSIFQTLDTVFNDLQPFCNPDCLDE